MTSEVILKPNLPLKANCQRRVTGDDTHVVFHLDWNVNIKVPLIGGMLERHAESEIRRFSQVEIEIIEDELRKHL